MSALCNVDSSASGFIGDNGSPSSTQRADGFGSSALDALGGI